MLIIARTRQYWWMVILTHESYDSVLVVTEKQKGFASLSENREWRCRCDVERQVVPDGGTRNRKRPPADERAERPDDVRQKTAAVVWMSSRKRGWNMTVWVNTDYRITPTSNGMYRHKSKEGFSVAGRKTNPHLLTNSWMWEGRYRVPTQWGPEQIGFLHQDVYRPSSRNVLEWDLKTHLFFRRTLETWAH